MDAQTTKEVRKSQSNASPAQAVDEGPRGHRAELAVLRVQLLDGLAPHALLLGRTLTQALAGRLQELYVLIVQVCSGKSSEYQPMIMKESLVVVLF